MNNYSVLTDFTTAFSIGFIQLYMYLIITVCLLMSMICKHLDSHFFSAVDYSCLHAFNYTCIFKQCNSFFGYSRGI